MPMAVVRMMVSILLCIFDVPFSQLCLSHIIFLTFYFFRLLIIIFDFPLNHKQIFPVFINISILFYFKQLFQILFQIISTSYEAPDNDSSWFHLPACPSRCCSHLRRLNTSPFLLPMKSLSHQHCSDFLTARRKHGATWNASCGCRMAAPVRMGCSNGSFCCAKMQSCRNTFQPL